MRRRNIEPPMEASAPAGLSTNTSQPTRRDNRRQSRNLRTNQGISAAAKVVVARRVAGRSDRRWGKPPDSARTQGLPGFGGLSRHSAKPACRPGLPEENLL